VIGGGSFGPILEQNIFFDEKTHSRRVLVLEAGPLVLPKHQQNLPVLGGDIEGLVRTSLGPRIRSLPMQACG
jgi:hypothetical protein